MVAEDIERLSRKGGNSLEYLAEYDLIHEKSNRERLLAHKNKQADKIIIDINPRIERKLEYPSDVWIGSRVISLPAETLTEKYNCHLEIIGSEHKDKRDYPCCRYYLFVVLDEDVPADTWLFMPRNNPVISKVVYKQTNRRWVANGRPAATQHQQARRS